MVSLLTILCISVALFGLTLEGSEAKSYSFTIPPGEDVSDLDLSKLDLGSLNLNDVDKSKITLTHYQLPGHNVTHTYKYKKPGKTDVHTYRYKKPGHTVTHHYRYKKPGHENIHEHRHKKPGHKNVHEYRYKTPGHNNTHEYRYRTPEHRYEKPVTGVYYIINVIYNYFAVGGRLTGIPPFDLCLLRYYVSQGPKNFCPSH